MASITLVSRNFPPLNGGMERLVHQLYGGLVKNHEVSLLGPNGCEDFVAPGSDVKSTAVSPTPLFLLFPTGLRIAYVPIFQSSKKLPPGRTWHLL